MKSSISMYTQKQADHNSHIVQEDKSVKKPQRSLQTHQNLLNSLVDDFKSATGDDRSIQSEVGHRGHVYPVGVSESMCGVYVCVCECV